MRRIRDLPLFWKLLLPFLALVVVFGALGTVVVEHDLSSRAAASLEQDLARRSLDARTAIHNRELYLLESVNFAANLRGMAEATRASDRARVTSLARSVLALKTDLDLVAVVDRQAHALVEFTATAPASGIDWPAARFGTEAMHDTAGRRQAGFVDVGGITMFAIAAPICGDVAPCSAAGVAVAAIALADLSAEGHQAPRGGVTLFASDGRLLASSGLAARPPGEPIRGLLTKTGRVRGRAVTSMYAPMNVGGATVGAVAVSLPRAEAFAAVRRAGFRLAAVVVMAMLAVVVVGALLSRVIVRQVRSLVATNRALGSGDLAARAPVFADDELGELARGVNQMAEQLQASYETLESRVAQRTAEVRRLLAERTEFFASMSHEFRTPLAVILSEADMLIEPRAPLTPRSAKGTGHTVRRSAEQLLSAINEILDLAQAEAGAMELELEHVRLAEVVAELRSTITGLARGSKLKVQIDVPRDLPAVVADRTRVREVILNLVDNAVKYTPAGGVVRLAAACPNGKVEFSVSDSGVGIPAEIGDRIFEPFFRVKGTVPVRGQASTGLGLALAKRVVEAHGGTIGYTSNDRAGTTFTFTLSRAG